MKHSTLIPAGLAVLTLCADPTKAHSWVEKLLLIASNGTFVGTPGYPRGFVPRTSALFSDYVSENQIPPNGRPTGTEILPTDLMCRQSQSIGNQTAGSPALVAAPGDNIALIYEENGHVTLLDRSPTKPVGSGTVFVYGTQKPANTDTYLGIHRVWNAAGTGGDKRGKLLATRPFDDGQCYQNNTSPLAESRRDKLGTLGNDLPCQNNIQLPEDAGTSGKYTLYWLWEWPTLDATGNVIANESYTTCMDIEMTPKKLARVESFKSEQLVDSRAIQAQLSTAFLVNPSIAEQLTTTQGVASHQSTAAPSAALVPLQGASNGAGGVSTVTETAMTAGLTKTEVVTVTTTICDCSSGATASPIVSVPGILPSSPILPAAPILSTTQAQASTTQTKTVATPGGPLITATVTSAASKLPDQVPSQTPSTAEASSVPISGIPVVKPFLYPNSSIIPGSSAATISAAGNAEVTPLLTATPTPATLATVTPTTSSASKCTATPVGSRRRRRNR